MRLRRKFDWRYLLGAALLLGVCAVLLGVCAVLLATFSLLRRPSQQELLLSDSRDERFGWSYELLVDGEALPYEPEFDEEQELKLPDGVEAIRIRRAMTESLPRAELGWMNYLDGVEIFLDDTLVHTDFPWEVRRDGAGYLRPTRADWDRLHTAQGNEWRRGRASLPANYLGMELTVTTYFPEEWGVRVPEYPILGSEESYIAQFVVMTTPGALAMVCYALLALGLIAVYLLDIPNGRADSKTLLLCLYFLLLFLNAASESYQGYYSALSQRLRLPFLSKLHVTPLYLYLALRLSGRWRAALCGGIAAWALGEIALTLYGARRGDATIFDRGGLRSFALFLVVVAVVGVDTARRARRGRLSKRRIAVFALIGAGATLFCMAEYMRGWGGARAYILKGLLTTMRAGDFDPILTLVTNSISIVALIVVISEFVRRTLRSQREMGVLQDRARQTMEGYQRLLTVQDATNALRHEMRHHMIALSGILGDGNADRAKRYVDAVAGDLDRLPTGRYSANVLVDVIAGSFLDRAQRRGIRVEHRLNLPPELNIADEDLSVFLSNMLQNALEACERMDAGAERFIRVEMRLRGQFLFVKCVNSAPEEAEREGRPGHGYGLSAMRRVAEKYNSTLVIERAAGEYALKSDLFLRE